MPSFLEYIKNEGKLPTHLTFSLAALMAFYTGTEIRDKALIGHRDGTEYQILDDAAVLEFFAVYTCCFIQRAFLGRRSYQISRSRRGCNRLYGRYPCTWYESSNGKNF